jgi:hypothetical protein
MTAEWVFEDRPSYFGRKRDEIQKGYDEKYGELSWKLAHKVGDRYLDFSDAIQLYEDAYYEFLRNHVGILNLLCNEAKEVWDNAETNVKCGFDYSAQENWSNHYQDISVRRVVFRLGRKFNGDKLVQIRHNSESQVGSELSPGRVPFHLPAYVEQPVKEGWWEKGTVEEFWQSNKVLMVLKE